MSKDVKKEKKHTEAQAEESSQTQAVETAEPLEEECVLLEPAPPEPDELAKRSAECEALKDQVLRLRAEFDNYRKRTARETAQIRSTATAELVCDLLPVLDNLERALEHSSDAAGGLAEGVRLVLNQMRDVLGARGLEAIPSVGEGFDPNIHEALAQAPSEAHAADTVMTEFQRGYRMAGLVIRPAKVVVSTGAPESATPEAPVETNTAQR